MEQGKLTMETLAEYGAWLRARARAGGTVGNYPRHGRASLRRAGGRPVTKELTAAWKEQLAAGYAPATVNAMLAAVNGLLAFAGLGECRVGFLKLQRRVFRPPERELNRREYEKLLAAARAAGKERLHLLLQAICATGVRVGEVKYLTVEAARAGRAEVALKGKIRTILLPRKLCRRLLRYARAQKIASGAVFRTRSGKGLSRRQIWWEMKGLCKAAGVAAGKVFPHNLRHLFAVTYYRAYRDVVRLADLLGHSSIETTRLYLATSGAEHARQLARLGLLS